MTMTIKGRSDNENSTNGTLTKSIPVQFEVDLAVKASHEHSNTFINFTQEDKGPKRLVNIYEVTNLAMRSLPVTVTFTFPTLLEHQFEVSNYQVSVLQNQTECQSTMMATSDYCNKEKNCKSIECDTFILDKYSTVQFTLSGDVAFGGLEQFVKDMPLTSKFTGDGADVTFRSFVNLSFYKQRYVQKSSNGKKGDKSFHQAQIDVRAEFTIPPHKELIIGTGAGGGLLLLIIITVVMFKMGCFKRKSPGDPSESDNEEEQCLQDQGKQPIEVGTCGGENSKALLENDQNDNNECSTDKETLGLEQVEIEGKNGSEIQV